MKADRVDSIFSQITADYKLMMSGDIGRQFESEREEIRINHNKYCYRLQREKVKKLTDSYIRTLLIQEGESEITPYIINEKRKIILIERELLKLKRAIRESN